MIDPAAVTKALAPPPGPPTGTGSAAGTRAVRRIPVSARLEGVTTSLADEFETGLARLPRARRPDPAYVEWFRELAARTGAGVFASYDEYDDWERQGTIAVFPESGRMAEGMPLPPSP